MPIPTTDQMVLPVLRHIADGREYRRLSLLDVVAEHFSLTKDERGRLSKSGQIERSLGSKGFIERATQKWHYRITTRGLEFLNQNSTETSEPHTNTGIQENLFTSSSEENLETGENNLHPEKSIEDNYQQIRKDLAVELLQKISENSPAFFEKLVIDLLVAMGYGGSREDAGKAVGGSGDGGIDGIINEDRLGLDVIYVQAKRWEGKVGAPPVRDFVGALQGKRARKGIFITTSEFSNSAQEYISAIDSRDSKVILIDGHQLAQLMIDHDVGVSTSKTYEIKRVDSDYFPQDTKNA